MKPQELRIGNYISLGPYLYDTWYKVDGIILAEFGKEDCDPYEPIPLTEDWLLKFGFVDKSIDSADQKVYQIDAKEIMTARGKINEGWYWYDGENGFVNDHNTMIYVHQLQNLYYALTGEELTIKEI